VTAVGKVQGRSGTDATSATSAALAGRVRSKLCRWFALSRVKDARQMPWRKTRNPYAVWLSEIMLQQTRVETVIPYYERFIAAFPTVAALAEAPLPEVLSLWSGLGYYRRARMLHAAAGQVVERWGGRFPEEVEDLRQLQGVGAYTAGAVSSIAYGRRAALVDGNVIRVLARLFAVDDDMRTAKGRGRIWKLAEELVAGVSGDPGDWNQALMELGATVCVPVRPACDECPLRSECAAQAKGLTGELPRSAPKSKPAEVARVAIVLASRSSVLLARRRPDALFGGLWEPPGAEGEVAPLARRLGIDEADLSPAGRVVHTLSHRRLVVDVMRGALGLRRRWPVPGPEYDAVEVVPLPHVSRLGQASFARKVLEVASASRQGLLSPGK
jgi:A/G-specific adenine glycosylase